jgi:hypothetical protein
MEELPQVDQTIDQKNLANHVRQKVDEVRASANRMAHEGQWMTNIAYLCGVNSVNYNVQSRQLAPINRAGSYAAKNKLAINVLLPTAQNRLARLCKNPPKYDIRPESNDNEDKEAARLSLQVLQTIWDQEKLDALRISLYMWVQQCGHAYAKVTWDPSKGNLMVDPITGEKAFEGDIKVEAVSAFEVFPDPLAKNEDDCQYMIQAKVRKLEYFKTQYPGVGNLVKEEDTWLLSLQYEQRINSMNSRGPSQGGLQDAAKNSAIELIKYEKASLKHPNGRMIITANGVLLEDKELPCGIIPLFKFDDTVIAGKYYPETPVSHARPLQDQYNETVARRADWVKKLLSGKMSAARGSALAQESLNNESGEVVYFTPVPNAPNGGMPMALQMPMIPSYAYEEEDRLLARINEIFGISEVSKGTLPSASIPAIGMQLLTEQDDTRIGVMTEQHEQKWAQVGSLILKYVEKYYKLPRKLKLAGKNLQYTVREFIGDDLRGNTDVIVIRGSTLPGSKTLKRQEVLNVYGQGLLGDPNDNKVREKVLGMLEFGDVAEVWKNYGIDQAQIYRGIKVLEAGQDYPISEWDNNPMWIEELNNYRKGDKFESLQPEIQELFLAQIENRTDMIIKVTGMNEAPLPPPPQMPAQEIPSPETTGLEQVQSPI